MTYIHHFERTDPRLGRHVHHDERSLHYIHEVLHPDERHSVDWTRRIPILDQGQLGACTGNALTGVLGTDSTARTASATVEVTADPYGIFAAGTRTLDEAFAVDAYRVNTRNDDCPGEYEPDDTGSSGVATGQTGKQVGLLDKYTHAMSLGALESALQLGPVMLGVTWYNSMFEPGKNAELDIDPSSGVAGGHEIECSGWDKGLDLYKIPNSWGTSFGDKGYCYVTGAGMVKLMRDQGDVTVPHFTV